MLKPSHKRQLADLSRLERLPGSRPALQLVPICTQHLARVVTAAGEQALLVLLAQIPHIEIRFCNPALARFDARDRIFVQDTEPPRPSADAPRSTPWHELVQAPAARTAAETDRHRQPLASHLKSPSAMARTVTLHAAPSWISWLGWIWKPHAMQTAAVLSPHQALAVHIGLALNGTVGRDGSPVFRHMHCMAIRHASEAASA